MENEASGGDSLSGGYLSAVLLGIVEGATEFLPVSSTGHLIVTANLLGETSDAAKLFEVVIQLGAIFAVCWHYRQRLLQMARNLLNPAAESSRLLHNLIIAFIPAAVLGLLFHSAIKAHLFAPVPVAIALIIGGIIILWAEKTPRGGDKTPVRHIATLADIRRRDALIIGFAQALALIPGVSRAGATIIGAMLWGVQRKTATEFSFLLALPTMFAAASFDLWQNRALLNPALIAEIAVGFAVSFIAALIVIRALLNFVSQHTFAPFGWYRIAFGVIILFILPTGDS